MSAVDKYEYKLKTEQMLELMEDGAYGKAAAIADEIDWKRVRNVTMLTNVSDIYEKNKEYQKSYDVLRIAYHRAEGSRKVIYRLCTLAIKTGNVDEAIDYYDDFMQIAPKDPNQHILRYQILRAQRAPVEQQIEALEEFKKAEYIEEWAYELAKLYQEAGMTAECLEECDDLILWFSEGQYVYKAMELKMQYKPLTPSQQEKYDHRFEKLSAETEEMPDLEAFYGTGTVEEETAEKETETPETVQNTEGDDGKGEEAEKPDKPIPEETVVSEKEEVKSSVQKTGGKTGKIGDTMRLDEALQKLLHPGAGVPSASEAAAAEEEEEPDITDLEEEIDEIESVADLGMVHRISEDTTLERNELKEPMPASSGLTELIPEESEELEEEILNETLDLSEAEEFLNEGEPEEETEVHEPDDGQITGQMSLADILSGWETQDEEMIDAAEAEELPEEAASEEEVPYSEEDVIEENEAEELFEEPEEITEEDEENEAEELFEEPEEIEETETEEVSEVSEEVIEETVEDVDAEDILEEKPAEMIEAEEEEPFEPEEEAAEAGEESQEPEPGAEMLDSMTEEAEEIEEGETTGEIMEEKKKTEPILPPDIQRMIDEIEGVIPPEEPVKEREVKKTVEEPHENMGKLADELRIDDDSDLDQFDDEPDDELEDLFEEDYSEAEDDLEEEYSDEYPEEEDWEEDDSDEYLVEEDWEEDDSEEYSEEDEFEEDYEEYPEAEEEEVSEDDYEYDEYEDDLEEDEYGADLFSEEDVEGPIEGLGIAADSGEEYLSGDDAEDMYDDEAPDFEEEFRVNPEHSQAPDDREIPDDDDDGMDILSATTPLSRKETAKMIATGKTAPLPLDEISDALSISDTGFIVHGRYDLQMQSGIGTRAGLTEEQKKLFSYFVPVRGMSEQLVDVLEQDKNCTNRNGTSKTGNLLIIGNKGNGKTVLAVDVVKAIQKQRNIKQGKVAIVTGESLNKKKIGDIFNKLYGGALIIEKAGKLNEKTVARLNKAMEKDTGELLIVLEEQRKPLDRLLSSNREFRRKFTSRLEVPIFINDELVTFGQTYAQENGYRIDEMGILALYSKIDSLQREDHAVTVAEVKEVMDEAIQHSQKASAKKLVKRVFGKNTDDADRILLSEKDFNV
ncbi:hypothetical protein H6B11_12850 [Mediterraneibacter glycyrrhizinilyticus]|nr:hypothetical protein [Mediterraneibacter glycyrrhizinilyticus]